MKRPELLLTGVLGAVALFVAFEVHRAPARASRGAHPDTTAAASGAAEGLSLSRMKSSTLPPPPPHDYADIRSRLAAARGVTYMDDILAERGNNVARWVDRSENPITVWVQRAPHIKDWWPEFRQRVSEAFYGWAVTGVPIRFLFVDDSATAEVRVRWVDRFNDAAAGKTYWERDQNWWIVGADIELAVHRSSGEPFDGTAIRTIAMHEAGHLIGLDHSSNPNDIMAARVHVMNLSPADLRTVALIYKLPPGPVEPPPVR
jgi:predicted Zn-dependent protease